ncbi:class I SAM-dependent methyltransferase [Anthocerotibacter panamensis]|uniref:class I SAM-dependent methyltransferase n=1 Tax=Anthocerotibacter panamensis TaxID=2857077 RepID=UPI001C4042C3|nr:class I SAM-dependent methyltransferase [Anthocerotibacter panamensis]
MAIDIKLESVIPWGRSLAEYTRMFDLTHEDLGLQFLDCGGGPASFNAEMSAIGRPIVSCDPLYQYTPAEIAAQIQATHPLIMRAVFAHQEHFVWEEIPSPEYLDQLRLSTMGRFLSDFKVGQGQGRYVAEALPELPFADGAFDLALCSHLLFTYSEQLSLPFHLASVQEMCRVAHEVRVFPLIDVTGEPSTLVPPVVQHLQGQGYTVEIRQVPYEFQRGGNQMLCVRNGSREA